MEWVDGNLGSKVTMKYPAVYLMGEHAKGETLSVAFAGEGQHQDAGAKMVHMAPRTSSNIVSKSVARGGGRTSYRGLIEIARGRRGLQVQRAVRRAAGGHRLPFGHLPVRRRPRGRRDDGPRGDRLQGQRRPALLPDEPWPVRGRGDGDDRARLRRAHREGAARWSTRWSSTGSSSCRWRARSADARTVRPGQRASSERPLTPGARPGVGPTTACRGTEQKEQHDDSHGRGSELPRGRRPGRTPTGRFDHHRFALAVASRVHRRHPDECTARPSTWRTSPCRTAARRSGASRRSSGSGACTTARPRRRGSLKVEVEAPEGVTVETVGRDDARVGRAGKPVDRVAAQAFCSFEKASVVTVPKEAVLDEPVRVALHGEGGVSYGHTVFEVRRLRRGRHRHRPHRRRGARRQRRVRRSATAPS